MSQTINLNQPESGFKGIITDIQGDKNLKKKLMSLGIRKGQQVEILHQRHNGVVVLSHGSRVALGANIAALVFLQPSPVQHSVDQQLASAMFPS
ncbi:MAG: ferrous iron transport protein A [Gammaproteobacteria bacterium]|nr:ferrous iron transport protein A [Gammaproteobacteria bacterium]